MFFFPHYNAMFICTGLVPMLSVNKCRVPQSIPEKQWGGGGKYDQMTTASIGVRDREWRPSQGVQGGGESKLTISL